MGKVIYDISMSLDGFIAGANARPEAGWAGLGDGGEHVQLETTEVIETKEALHLRFRVIK